MWCGQAPFRQGLALNCAGINLSSSRLREDGKSRAKYPTVEPGTVLFFAVLWPRYRGLGVADAGLRQKCRGGRGREASPPTIGEPRSLVRPGLNAGRLRGEGLGGSARRHSLNALIVKTVPRRVYCGALCFLACLRAVARSSQFRPPPAFS
jgi:hypothetical protein